MSQLRYESKNFVVKDIWQLKEFNRKDGSQGTVQKIINKDDVSLTVWDMKDLKATLRKGNEYHATALRKKVNQDGYDEYHTCSRSRITPLATDANKERHYEDNVIGKKDKPAYNAQTVEPKDTRESAWMNKPKEEQVPSYTKKDLHDVIVSSRQQIAIINDKLDFIVEKLGWISASIELLERKKQ